MSELFLNYNLNLGYSLIVFNVCIYLFSSTALFSIILIVSDNSLFSLNKLKNLNGFYFFLVSFIILLLSLAGIPPLFGFIGKLLLYIQLLAYNSYFFFVLLLTFNTFILYFYIQNVRFMISKNTNKNQQSIFFYNTSYETVFSSILFIMFFNLFGIFFFESFINFFFF